MPTELSACKKKMSGVRKKEGVRALESLLDVFNYPELFGVFFVVHVSD